MTEDANAALSIIRSQVALAGYSRPVGVTTQTTTVAGVPTTTSAMTRAYSGIAASGGANNFIVGCDGGFQNPRAHELNISLLGCKPVASGSTASTNPAPDAIAVVYEGDTANTYPNSDNLPTDCLGNTVPNRVEPALLSVTPNLRLVSNKFYVDTSTNVLYCLGNGRNAVTETNDSIATPSNPTGTQSQGTLPQAIVENIVDLQIVYGVDDLNTTATGAPASRKVVGYLSATDLANLGTDVWRHVLSARICVAVQSAGDVPAGVQTKYLDCQGNVSNSPAKKLIRTFSTTVVLHNRI
jgi:hypothetical protein